MTDWVRRITDITSWEPLDVRIDWRSMEGQLGFGLPEDFKKIAETFGVGEFSGYLNLLTGQEMNDFSVIGVLTGLRRVLTRVLHRDEAYSPYRIFDGDGEKGGLIPWARGVEEAEFFWLAEGDDPNHWPVIARLDAEEEWHRFDMSTAEFVFRMLDEDETVEPFTVPEEFGAPRYLVY
ncbi:hypothetical protein ACH40E_32190 [Streptomyces acidicola]|uniref:hypothetical protein n=1 Tax=Streptomyces acidicola TaxID=2596892 RepID=UPI003799013F